MTAITPDALDGSTRTMPMGTLNARLSELLDDRRGRAVWWVELTRRLDDLAETVHSAPGDLMDPNGFAEQIRSDAPHLMPRWLRLARERDDLFERVTEVRILAGRSAGDPEAIGPVSRAIRELMARVRRFQEGSTDVMMDVYERDDMGGE